MAAGNPQGQGHLCTNAALCAVMYLHLQAHRAASAELILPHSTLLPCSATLLGRTPQRKKVVFYSSLWLSAFDLRILDHTQHSRITPIKR